MSHSSREVTQKQENISAISNETPCEKPINQVSVKKLKVISSKIQKSVSKTPKKLEREKIKVKKKKKKLAILKISEFL